MTAAKRARGLRSAATDIPERSLGSVLLDPDDAGIEALTQYQRNPIGFLVEVLGIPEETLRWSLNEGYGEHQWDGTVDPLVALAEALRDWKDVGVESSTSTGKSFTVAGLILWFIAVWRGGRVFTFAPKEDQLRLYIWKEIGEMWPRFRAKFPKAELLDLQIRMVPGKEGWGAVGYAVGVRAGEQSATKAQGMHAEHLLLVYEETPGIPLPVLDAGEATCTGEKNVRIAIGNPDHQLDTLHRFCTSADVRHVRISSHDHPNVVTGRSVVPGGAVGRKAADWGEESPRYRSRIRGISPAESVDALLRRAWIDAAIARHHQHMAHLGPGERASGWRAKGVDVARSQNGDQGAIANFCGPICERVDAFACPDVVKLGERVYQEMQDDNVRPEHVGSTWWVWEVAPSIQSTSSSAIAPPCRHSMGPAARAGISARWTARRTSMCGPQRCALAISARSPPGNCAMTFSTATLASPTTPT
jgi:hypothetical protein